MICRTAAWSCMVSPCTICGTSIAPAIPSSATTSKSSISVYPSSVRPRRLRRASILCPSFASASHDHSSVISSRFVTSTFTAPRWSRLLVVSTDPARSRIACSIASR